MTPERLEEAKRLRTQPIDLDKVGPLVDDLIAEVERCWKMQSEHCDDLREMEERIRAAEFNVYRDRTVRRMKAALNAIARMSARSGHDDACACDLCFVWDKADEALLKDSTVCPEE